MVQRILYLLLVRNKLLPVAPESGGESDSVKHVQNIVMPSRSNMETAFYGRTIKIVQDLLQDVVIASCKEETHFR